MTDISINVRIGQLSEVEAAKKLMPDFRRILSIHSVANEPKVSKGESKTKTSEYGVLLSARDVAKICGCSRSTAYEIMRQTHRPRWQNGGMVRLHRDLFLKQLEEETMRNMERVDY